MREAYRLIKPQIYDELTQMNKKVTFMLIYAGSEETTFPVISSAVQHGLKLVLECPDIAHLGIGIAFDHR